MKASCGHVLSFILDQAVEIFQYFCQFIKASSSPPAYYYSPFNCVLCTATRSEGSDLCSVTDSLMS